MSSIPFSLLSIFTASFLHSPQPSRNLTLNRDQDRHPTRASRENNRKLFLSIRVLSAPADRSMTILWFTDWGPGKDIFFFRS